MTSVASSDTRPLFATGGVVDRDHHPNWYLSAMPFVAVDEGSKLGFQYMHTPTPTDPGIDAAADNLPALVDATSISLPVHEHPLGVLRNALYHLPFSDKDDNTIWPDHSAAAPHRPSHCPRDGSRYCRP